MKVPTTKRVKLLALWGSAVRAVGPGQVLRQLPELSAPESAFLFWGKAAAASALAVRERLDPASPKLIVSQEPSPNGVSLGNSQWCQGEHPIPGAGSLRAGEAILEFFDSLRRLEIKNLWVFLSGGASSLAWVPPAHLAVPVLRKRLQDLYIAGLDIRELNALRSRLCALKGGGAGEWLRRLAPETLARVFVFSDVFPFGPEVVGSGPFWGKIPHQILSDNRTLVSEVARAARNEGLTILSERAGDLSDWTSWVKTALQAKKRGKSGVMILGGEPRIKVIRSRKRRLGARHRARQGGRQCQIAASILLELFPEILCGAVEVVCMSSDGRDGNSGAAGAWLNQNVAKNLQGAANLCRLRSAIASFNSAAILRQAGALIPARDTGTNLQDVMILRIR